MHDQTSLQEQAEKIRVSGVLGQSRLIRLFNFLVECSAAATIPKEAVIAADVFDKTTAFDVSQDSIVRVYIHNLRRKLDQFYAGPGKDEPVRLVLPKGEYRLMVVPADMPPPVPDALPLGFGISRRQSWIAAVAAGLAVLVCVTVFGLILFYRPSSPWQSARNSPIWSRLLQNDKPIVVVLGDYYIFGDTEQTSDVKRLIREFAINSKDDLEQYLQMNPELAEHYMDVGLGYLPTSSAFALANVMPVLAAGDRRRVRVMLMSSLDPGTIKSANIVYIGLLSGLGALQKVVFAASRFRVGDSFDELIDGKTDHHYFSGANQYAGDSSRRFGVGYHDYGLFSTFSGVGGNQFIVIASTQDEGLRQMSEELTDRVRLDELSKQSAGKADFEALFQVFGMDNLDLNGKLLVTSPLNPSNIWTAP
jgi:hypothetical protein